MADKGARVIVIQKKAKGHAHHGGAWKVAYADFVTAMMALFMVLWLVSQTDQSTRQKLAEYFRTGVFSGAPALVMGGSGVADKGYLDTSGKEATAEQEALKNGAKAVRNALLSAQEMDPQLKKVIERIDVKVTADGLLIQVLDGGDDLLFDLSSAELKPQLKIILAQIAPALAKLKNRIQVHGHTDARPFPAGSGRTNWDLSFLRADTARKALEQNGLPAAQVDGVFAHAANILYVSDNPLDARNRRLAILAVRAGAETVAAHGVVPTQPLVPLQRTQAEHRPIQSTPQSL